MKQETEFHITDADIRSNRERELGLTGADIVTRRCVCWGCPTRDGAHCERTNG